MTELKNTLLIFKTRWKEAALIILLSIVPSLVNKFLPAAPKTINFETLLRVILSLLYILLLLAFILGFLRTVHTANTKPQTFATLLETGKHFLWRLIKFGLLYLVIYIFLALAVFLLTEQFASTDVRFFEMSKVAPWRNQICLTLPRLILAKLELLFPALIIVLDCRVFKCFAFSKKCRLFNAKELVLLFGLLIATGILYDILPLDKLTPIILKDTFVAIYFAGSRFIRLMMGVMAVRFVASLNLPYDIVESSLNSEGLLKT